jgi:hypothetical protein
VVGCVFLGFVLLVLGLAVLLIPLGTALSFGQAAVVTALLGAAAWTAWTAWRESGPLALILSIDGVDHCFPALPEDENGLIILEFENHDGVPRVLRGDETPAGFGGSSYTELLVEAVGRPRLELRRRYPGARRASLVLTRGGATLWEVPDVRVGRPIPLSHLAVQALGLSGPAGLLFLDR